MAMTLDVKDIKAPPLHKSRQLWCYIKQGRVKLVCRVPLALSLSKGGYF